MNAYEFTCQHFGRHLSPQDPDAWISKSYKVRGKTKLSRLVTGSVCVWEGGAALLTSLALDIEVPSTVLIAGANEMRGMIDALDIGGNGWFFWRWMQRPPGSKFVMLEFGKSYIQPSMRDSLIRFSDADNAYIAAPGGFEHYPVRLLSEVARLVSETTPMEFDNAMRFQAAIAAGETPSGGKKDAEKYRTPSWSRAYRAVAHIPGGVTALKMMINFKGKTNNG